MNNLDQYTIEQINNRFNRALQSGSGAIFNGNYGEMFNGRIWRPVITQDQFGNPTISGYDSVDPSDDPGKPNYSYDLNGNLKNTWLTQKDEEGKELLKAAALVGGVVAGGMGLQNMLGGGSAMMGPPTAGQYASNIAGFEQSLSPYLAQGASSMMGPPTEAMFNQQIAPFEQSLQQYLPSGLPKTPGTPPGGNGPSSLLPDSMKGLLGPAATLLGAAAGAQGKDASQSQTKKMDPRLEEFVYGDLLPRTKGLLAEEMSPERRAQWNQMRGVGMGLLSQPVAGNAFDRFYGKR